MPTPLAIILSVCQGPFYLCHFEGKSPPPTRTGLTRRSVECRVCAVKSPHFASLNTSHECALLSSFHKSWQAVGVLPVSAEAIRILRGWLLLARVAIEPCRVKLMDTSPAEAKALALCWMAHLVADAHKPCQQPRTRLWSPNHKTRIGDFEMKKAEVKIGGKYYAHVTNKRVEIQIDSAKEMGLREEKMR